MPKLPGDWVCFTWAILALALISGAVYATAGSFGLHLRADPDRVPADGKTPVVVLAEVVDAFGRPAPDGTLVYFATTVGNITSPVQTIGGLAQTVLTASNMAGRAMVSAIIGELRETIQVEFLAQPGSASRGSRLIELSGDEIAYSAEKKVFVATWQAILRRQAVEIQADGIQYDMNLGVVCAQGNVVLRSGGEALSADALRYDLVMLKGRLVRLAEHPEQLLVEGERLKTRPDLSQDSVLWEPLKTDDTRTWVKAKRAIIDPHEKVILDHATFYVNEMKVMSLRRHVLNPAFGGALFGQAVGFSSASGVTLDLPMYYSANAGHVGSLHIARNRTLDGAHAGRGWLLGIREEYIREGRAEGALELDDLLHPGRGIRWEHQHQIGSLGVNLDASAMQFNENSPRLRSTNLSFLQPVSGGRLSLVLSRSDYGVSRQSLADLEYRLHSRRAEGDIIITPALRLRSSQTQTRYEMLLFDPDTGEPLQVARENTSSTTSPAVDVSLSLPSRNIGHGLRLSAGLSTGYAWNVGRGSHGLLDGRVFLDRRFGRNSFASLGFTYSSGSSLLRNSLFSSGRQLLTLTGQTSLGGTLARLSASQDLAGQRRFGSLFLSRPLPFGTDVLGGPLWNLELNHVSSHFGDFGAANTKFALGRALGRYQAYLCYSPQGVGEFSSRPWFSPLGYGYTYSGSRRVWLELTARPQ